MNIGLLILRVVTGLLLAGHGVQKVSYHLGGEGLSGGVTEFRDDGFRGGMLTALTAGVTQIGGGLLITAGAATPLAASMAVGVMTVATTVKWHNGLWAQNNGCEYPAFLALTAACLALTGPGRYSVDEALGRLPWPSWLAMAAIVLGTAGGLLTRVLLHRSPPPETSTASA
jgi:putative oxidoreductase